MQESARPWVAILAAGRSRSYAAQAVTAEGECIPRRYHRIDGAPAPVERALARARRLTAPDRVLAIVEREHRRWWSGPLASVAPDNLIVQPRDRGTAIAVLLPFLHVLRRASRQAANDVVVVLSADDHVEDEAVFEAALRRAVAAARASDNRPVLLGAPPRPEEAGGLRVLVGDDDDGLGVGTRLVRSVAEAPPRGRPAGLESAAALRAGLTLASRVSGVLRLYERSAPWLLRAFMPSLSRRWWWRPWTLAELFDLVPDHDFCRDVLWRAPELLRVLAVPPCGWVDLAARERAGGLGRLPPRTAGGGDDAALSA